MIRPRETDGMGELISWLWFVVFLKCVWLNTIYLRIETNQINQTDQTNEIDQIYRPWYGRKMFLNT